MEILNIGVLMTDNPNPGFRSITDCHKFKYKLTNFHASIIKYAVIWINNNTKYFQN